MHNDLLSISEKKLVSKTLARTLQQFGISDERLASLQNLGMAAHPHTAKIVSHSSAAVHLLVELFLVFCIDDYHNIHTKHRPENKTQTEAIHMTTLLVKVFLNIKAISNHAVNTPLLPTSLVNVENLMMLVGSNMADLSQSCLKYA